MTKYRLLKYEIFLEEKNAKKIDDEIIKIIMQNRFVKRPKKILDYSGLNCPAKILKTSDTWREL